MDNVGNLEARVITLETTQVTIIATQAEHARMISRLETNMTEMQEALGRTAKKDDIAELRNHLDEQINGILKNALNAMPGHMGMILAGITAVLAIASFMAALWHH